MPKRPNHGVAVPTEENKGLANARPPFARPGLRRLLFGTAVYLFATVTGATNSAANAHHAYNRPVVVMPGSFTLNYGDHVTLCATITPARLVNLFKNPFWDNEDGAPGVFTSATGTGGPECNQPNQVELTVASNVTTCLPEGGVVAVLNNHATVLAHGTVLLPNVEVATPSGPDLSIQNNIDTKWNITFGNDKNSANFNGLQAGEELWISQGDPNTCGMKTGPGFQTLDWVLGGAGALPNSLVDENAKGAEQSDETCISIVSQVFHIGNYDTGCVVPSRDTPVKMKFVFANGAPSFSRTDTGGQ